MIQLARRLFFQQPHIADISRTDRQRVAGLILPTAEDPVDYRWFGSMNGAGTFWQAINNNDASPSLGGSS